MNTTIVKSQPNKVSESKPSALKLMASRLSVEPEKLLDTLKATVFKGSTNEELLMLTVIANEYQLSPFLREIFAFPAKGGGITPVISVDGWNKMLVRQPDFDGIEFEFAELESGELVSCTATIFVKNRAHPCKVTEYFSECKRDTQPWRDMPHRMLRNRTLCQASRVAFGFSGVQHEEEVIDVTSTVMPQMPSEPLKKIAAPKPEAESAPKPNEDGDLAPTEPGKTKTGSPQAELETLCVTNGHTFSALQKWGEETGNLPDGSSLTGFAEVPTDVCKRLLRAQAGLLKGLELVKK